VARVAEAQTLLQHSAFESRILELRASIDLADAYRDAGRFPEAIRAFEQVSAHLTDLGRDNTDTAATLYNNWALALLQSGRPLEAEGLFRRAMDIDRADNTDAAVTATTLPNYGKSLRDLGRLDEAADYVERAYAKGQQAGHEVAMNQALIELGRIYREQRKFGVATEKLAQVEPRLRSALPPGHYAFAAIASERSLIAEGSGDLKQALQLANQAVEMVEAAIKSGGQGAGLLPVFLFRRSALELELGKPEKARADAERSVSLLQDSTESGTFSVNVGRAYMALGHALQAQGNSQAVQAAFRSAAEHLEKTLGPDHPDTRTARQLVAPTQ
jgi:tetratricopeptide (TPR) repeat protein